MSAARIAIQADDPALAHAAGRPLEAAHLADAEGAELIVLLLEGPAEDRLERIQATVERHRDARVVAALPPDAGTSAYRRALRAGVHGIVLDDQLSDALEPAVRVVLAGMLALPPALRRQLAPPALSHREKQILALVAAGYTNRQIADTLFVAESTVKSHLSSAFGKLDARSRAEAAALVLDPDEGIGAGILGLVDRVPRAA